MILLDDDEIDKAMKYAMDWAQDYTIRNGEPDPIPERQVAIAQAKKTLISVGKEALRMDGSVYLVPDYHKYREALKEMEIE